jgi:hypothetical protein
MSKQNFFTDGTLIDKLGVLLERTLVQTDCVVAATTTSNVGTASNRDVALNITIPKVGGGTEVKAARYYQLDLAGIANLQLPKRLCNEDTTIYDLLPTIKRITGIPFTTDDLVDAPVVVTGAVTEFTLPLVAKVGSKWFKGRYDLPVLRKPLLSTATPYGLHMGPI